MKEVLAFQQTIVAIVKPQGNNFVGSLIDHLKTSYASTLVATAGVSLPDCAFLQHYWHFVNQSKRQLQSAYQSLTAATVA